MIGKLLRQAVAAPVRLSMLGMTRGPHIWRYQLYRHLEALFKAIPRDDAARVLAISGSERLCNVLGFREGQITVANYPDYDLLSLTFADESFDFVVSDQVLEHVDGDPYVAIKESHRVLKRGGIAVHTTCFIQPVHWGPKDLWRFSPDALRLLARDFAELIDVGGWGNRWIWPYIWIGLRFEGVPEASWHPVHKLATLNEAEWPAVTWVVARRS